MSQYVGRIKAGVNIVEEAVHQHIGGTAVASFPEARASRMEPWYVTAMFIYSVE